MPNSVYKIITLVGTSTESWEKAAATAVEQAAKTLRDLRIAEVEELDMHIENGKIAESWVSWDNVAMLSQLGFFPPPPAPEQP